MDECSYPALLASFFTRRPSAPPTPTEAEAMLAAGAPAAPPSVYYMKQTIGNACGTIGLLHCAANSQPPLEVGVGSFLARFLIDTEALTPEQRGAYLESPPKGGPSMSEIHEVRRARLL